MADSIRYDLNLSRRLLRTVPSLVLYGTVIAVLLMAIPPRVFDGGAGLAAKGVITVGVIGAWRYLWQLTHIVRAAIYEHFKYPRMRFEADKLSGDERFPGRIFFCDRDVQGDSKSLTPHARLRSQRIPFGIVEGHRRNQLRQRRGGSSIH